MALVDQDKEVKIRLLIDHVASEFSNAKLDLYEELNTSGKYDATHVSGRDASAKAHVSDGIRALRWLFDNLSVTVPAAFNDAEIDAINEHIRQKDDGL